MLSQLRPGDEVLVCHDGYTSRRHIVSFATEDTLAVNCLRYDRTTGFERGVSQKFGGGHLEAIPAPESTPAPLPIRIPVPTLAPAKTGRKRLLNPE